MPDGPPRHSIRGRLLAGLLGSLVVAGLVMGYAAYRRAHHDLDELLDYQLQQLAFSLSHQSVASVSVPPGTPLPEPDFITQVWGRDGVLVFYSRPSVAIPMRPRPGFSNMDWKGQSWRVFTQLDGNRIIQVAHPLSLRQEMAADFARRAVLPLVALVPLLAIGIWILVGRALAPLSSISAALRARTPAALEPLPQGNLPEELVPLVGSLNDLLGRLQQTLEVQRQFVGDAAHELRSPLTAVQLQLSLLKRASGEEERTAAIERLERGVQRSNRLVQQLLTLARQDPQLLDVDSENVDMHQLAREVVADFEPQALLHRQTLRLDSPADAVLVRGDREALRVMLSNLIDNALRYTPSQGSVIVRASREGDAALIEVEDTGLGIPPEQRLRVFDRFYRVPRAASEEGSGLGLAIVKRIADRHTGTVSLDDAVSGSGLRVSVRLPLAPATQTAT
jgi:two-component system, OmpR family, sensor kinase